MSTRTEGRRKKVRDGKKKRVDDVGGVGRGTPLVLPDKPTSHPRLSLPFP